VHPVGLLKLLVKLYNVNSPPLDVNYIINNLYFHWKTCRWKPVFCGNTYELYINLYVKLLLKEYNLGTIIFYELSYAHSTSFIITMMSMTIIKLDAHKMFNYLF
jgi:hypothetical protein